MSHTALAIAAVARAMTPFSGPNHRCWGSATTVACQPRCLEGNTVAGLTVFPEGSHIGEHLFDVHTDDSLCDLLNSVDDLGNVREIFGLS
jgi:hypothetical protein